MRCSHCDAATPGLKQCSGCLGNVFYCGKDCQVAHWKTHKLDCKKAAAEKKEREALDLESHLSLGISAEEELYVMKESARCIDQYYATIFRMHHQVRTTLLQQAMLSAQISEW